MDLDRLHKVESGELTDRRCGKTFARICEVASNACMEYSPIIVIVSYYWDLKYIYPMMQRIFFKEYNLNISKVNNFVYKSNKSLIKFVTEDDQSEKLNGIDGYIVFMRHFD